MNWLIWIGVVITIAGLGLLASCIATVIRAKRSGIEGAEMAKIIQSMATKNMAAMGLSGLGLMVVVIGLVFV